MCAPDTGNWLEEYLDAVRRRWRVWGSARRAEVEDFIWRAILEDSDSIPAVGMQLCMRERDRENERERERERVCVCVCECVCVRVSECVCVCVHMRSLLLHIVLFCCI